MAEAGKCFTTGFLFCNLYFEGFRSWPTRGCFNAARELEWFSASVAGVLPDLSVAGDDARETYSLASGVATDCRSRTRRGRAGSTSGRAGRLWVKTAASGSGPDAYVSAHPSTIAQHRHPGNLLLGPVH